MTRRYRRIICPVCGKKISSCGWAFYQHKMKHFRQKEITRSKSLDKQNGLIETKKTFIYKGNVL